VKPVKLSSAHWQLSRKWYRAQRFKKNSYNGMYYYDSGLPSPLRTQWLLEVSESPDTIAGWVHPETGWVHPGDQSKIKRCSLCRETTHQRPDCPLKDLLS
jgi:hypothetical protein